MKFLEESIKDLEKQINGIVGRNAQDEAEILQSEKGVGEQTTAILLASLRWLMTAEKCNLEDMAAELVLEMRCLWLQLALFEAIRR